MKSFDKVQHQLLELCSTENLRIFVQRSSHMPMLLYLDIVLEIPAGDDILMDLGNTLP